jgi:hypothetical protein
MIERIMNNHGLVAFHVKLADPLQLNGTVIEKLSVRFPATAVPELKFPVIV